MRAGTVPASVLVREALKGSDMGLTLGELRRALLTAGIDFEPAEIASFLGKLHGAGEVSRERIARPPGLTGPREVWRYAWRRDTQAPPPPPSLPTHTRPVPALLTAWAR